MGGNRHCAIRCGDSNRVVDDLVAQLSLHSYRYHFAFVDPFGPKALHFQTIAKLAQLRRMDMLIHFPIGAIKRNLKVWLQKQDAALDNFLGTPIWRERIQDFSLSHVAVTLLDIYKDQLRRIGYPEDGLRLVASQDNVIAGMPTVSVRNRTHVDLYFLILISRHPLAQAIWSSVISITPSGQTTLRLTGA
jgi:three-Cys-motif partner protein